MSEYINGIIYGSILTAFLLATAWGCSEFIEHQNLDKYFGSDGAYDFSDTEYLLTRDTNLCGTTYLSGRIINKNTYDHCINK